MADLDFDLTVALDEHGACRMTLRGELDLATAGRLEQALAEAGDAVLLDLRGLTFMDSTGVRLLVQAHLRSTADSERLTLLRGQAAVQRVLQLSGVDVLLPFADGAGRL